MLAGQLLVWLVMRYIEEIELYPSHNRTKARRTLETKIKRFCPQFPFYYRHASEIAPDVHSMRNTHPLFHLACSRRLKSLRSHTSRRHRVLLPQIVIRSRKPSTFPNSTLVVSEVPQFQGATVTRLKTPKSA